VQKLAAEIIGVSFLVELSFLEGRQRLQDQHITSLLTY
jgi:adenine/guanine phosphoribosyltransferase-like PRPP-binding protein